MAFPRVALYQTCAIPADVLQRIQHALDTNGQDGFPPPGHISLTAAPDATHGMTPAQIHAHHWSALPPDTVGSPIVIMDEQTLRDDTLLVVAAKPEPDDSEDEGDPALDAFELGAGSGILGVRFAPAAVPLTVVNLQIGNQDLTSYTATVDNDRVWRSFD
ncbi:hypothetical protein AURDEDRAFT_188671 [Auricularia subglabra TFB-10046 SS5]|nr:hypothetical protein AURDEDRAFT_188671 [Auricularia subglabra TFB-10046 SS5]